MADLTMKVEGMAGCDCAVLIEQMCKLATALGVNVEANLNGVTTFARPGADPKALADEWGRALKRRDSRIKFASV